jgi:hypothetical protein
MSNVIEILAHKRLMNHELCRQCPHDETCDSVCMAIETLVQLCKVKSPMQQIEYVYNIGTHLDLDNSFSGMSDKQ